MGARQREGHRANRAWPAWPQREEEAVKDMSSLHAPKPTVPVSYVWLMIRLAEERGVSPQQLLSGLRISPAQLDSPEGRIGLLDDYAALCKRAMAWSGEPGLGYAFGLRATLTTHGILGYGLMSQPTLGHVLGFAARFGAVLRMPAWDMHFSADDDWACMRATESISHGELRRFSAEQLLATSSCSSTTRPPITTRALRPACPVATLTAAGWPSACRAGWPMSRCSPAT